MTQVFRKKSQRERRCNKKVRRSFRIRPESWLRIDWLAQLESVPLFASTSSSSSSPHLLRPSLKTCATARRWLGKRPARRLALRNVVCIITIRAQEYTGLLTDILFWNHINRANDKERRRRNNESQKDGEREEADGEEQKNRADDVREWRFPLSGCFLRVGRWWMIRRFDGQWWIGSDRKVFSFALLSSRRENNKNESATAAVGCAQTKQNK